VSDEFGRLPNEKLVLWNEQQKGVRRQFTNEKARVKLNAIYPIIK
jgi:hypothetical protein